MNKQQLEDFLHYIRYEIENTKADLRRLWIEPEQIIDEAFTRLAKLEENIAKGYYE